MTNKEAIEELKAKVNLAKELEDEEVNFISIEVLNLAIKALEERPQGKWIISQTMDCHSDIVNVYTCPFCGKKFYSAYPFCHCGADMRGDAE